MRTSASSRLELPRQRCSRLALVAGVVISLLFSTVGVAEAQTQRAQDTRGDEIRATQVRPPARVVETLRLACAPDSIDGERGVLCQWSEATNPRTRGYQLFRITDGAPRQLVTTVGVNGRLGYFDTDVAAPSSQTYGVISVNRNGRLVGRSAPVTVSFGQELEQLRLACAPDIVNGERGVLCQWSQTEQPNARGYQLYRIVDTDERRVIASTGLDGRNGYFDTDLSSGTSFTYGIVAVDGAGAALAVGGPELVRWPAAD